MVLAGQAELAVPDVFFAPVQQSLGMHWAPRQGISLLGDLRLSQIFIWCATYINRGKSSKEGTYNDWMLLDNFFIYMLPRA